MRKCGKDRHLNFAKKRGFENTYSYYSTIMNVGYTAHEKIFSCLLSFVDNTSIRNLLN